MEHTADSEQGRQAEVPFALWNPPTAAQYSLTIQGAIPTDLWKTPLGQTIRVPDKAAAARWEELRWQTMMAWRHKMLKRCALAFRIVQPDSALHAAEVAASAIRLMARAGVIQYANASCVHSCYVTLGRGRHPRIEVTLYDLSKRGKSDGEIDHETEEQPVEEHVRVAG